MSILNAKFLFLFFLLLSLSGFAEEAAKSEKSEKKELPEWVELQAQISTLDTRRQQEEESITKLIEEKRHLPANSPQVKAVIDEMVADYNEMRKLTEERDKKLTVFKFRFPEKGLAEDRKYDHAEIKPLEQLEKELGLDGRLNRNLKKMRSQYQLKGKATDTAAEESDENTTHQKSSKSNGGNPNQKSIDETGQLTLKK